MGGPLRRSRWRTAGLPFDLGENPVTTFLVDVVQGFGKERLIVHVGWSDRGGFLRRAATVRLRI
jgi:hypothetical protein